MFTIGGFGHYWHPDVVQVLAMLAGAWLFRDIIKEQRARSRRAKQALQDALPPRRPHP